MMKRMSLPIPFLLAVLVLGALGCNLFGSGEDAADNVEQPTVPEIQGSSLADGTQQVELDPEIGVTFSETMNQASVEAATSFSAGGGAAQPFSSRWLGNLYVIEAETDLSPNTAYTLRIGTGAESEAGQPLASAWTMSFQTQTPWPVVMETSPPDGSAEQALNLSPWIRFSRDMDQASVEAALAVAPAADYTTSWPDEDQINLFFTQNLSTNTDYTITIGASAQSQGGQSLPAAHSFAFRTGTLSDETPPTIVAWNPANGATEVAVDVGVLTITFSEPVNPESVQPERVDARLAMAMGDQEPVWNETMTELRVLTARLPAGSEVFVDLGVFTDAAGNAAANPAEWRIATAGTADWFPAGAHDMWHGEYFDYDDAWGGQEGWVYQFEDRVENVAGADFEIGRYRFSGEDQPASERDEAEFFSKFSDRIEIRGFANLRWEEGDTEGTWEEQTFDPAVDWLQMSPGLGPVAGHSWTGASTFSSEGMTGDLAFTGEVIGFADLVMVFPDGRESDEEMILPHCAMVRVSHEIGADPDGDGPEEFRLFHEGADTLWYCAGVGKVMERGSSVEYDDDGAEEHHYAERIYRWFTGQD